MSSRRTRAFTLIELLVVMAIISILAAQLFPTFAKAREKARTIACVSNQKQIALAGLMYTMDYDEVWLSLETTTTTTFGDGRGWAEELQPYMKNTQVLQCHSGRNRSVLVMYLANDQLASGFYGAIDEVSRTITFYDGETTPTDSDPGDFQFAIDFGRDQCGVLGLAEPPGHPELRPRHNEGWNAAYADGHVKWTTACGEGSATGPTRFPW